MKLELSVKSQSVETSGITKDYKEAICEYVWNGFEANATAVEIEFTDNGLGGVSEVIIRDNGDGIPFSSLNDTFGAFLASQKNGLSLQLKSKANKGKGRFSFLAFATNAEWKTVFSENGSNSSFTVAVNSINKNEYDVSEPIPTDKCTGTEVSITGVDSLTICEVTGDGFKDALLQTFAWYLYLNSKKSVSLKVNNSIIDYSTYINSDMSVTKVITIDDNIFSVNLIVWAERIKENFCAYYLDAAGIVCGKDTTTFNRNTVNFNHSVFVKSIFFDSKTDVSLTEITSDGNEQIAIEPVESEKAVLRKLKSAIQEIISESLSKHMAGQADKAIREMIDRKSFPEFSNDIYGEIRKRDLENVVKEIYRADSRIFYKLKPVQEKSFLSLLNLLLNSEERENVLSIIEGIVELSPEQRSDFANVLKKTRLENIVSSIKFIEDRYAIIEILKSIVYEYTQYANERNNVQKIIEQHYWLFGEQYSLVTADQRMQKALQEYLYLLYGDSAPQATLSPDEESERRMDIFACGTRKTEDGFETSIEENLVVELKAPNVVLGKKVLRQIEDYMDFIRKQPQFNSQYRRWKFIAVCGKVDDDVKSRYTAEESKGKKGLVTKIYNYEVYALTWDDVFKSFELSHGFVLDKLKMDKEEIAKEVKNATQAQTPKLTVENLTKVACE